MMYAPCSLAYLPAYFGAFLPLPYHPRGSDQCVIGTTQTRRVQHRRAALRPRIPPRTPDSRKGGPRGQAGRGKRADGSSRQRRRAQEEHPLAAQFGWASRFKRRERAEGVTRGHGCSWTEFYQTLGGLRGPSLILGRKREGRRRPLSQWIPRGRGHGIGQLSFLQAYLRRHILPGYEGAYGPGCRRERLCRPSEPSRCRERHEAIAGPPNLLGPGTREQSPRSCDSKRCSRYEARRLWRARPLRYPDRYVDTEKLGIEAPESRNETHSRHICT